MPGGDATGSESHGSNGPSAAPGAADPALPAGDVYYQIESRAVTSEAERWKLPERDCPPRELEGFVVSDLSPVLASIEVSQALYGCAQEVGLAPAGDHQAIARLETRGVAGPLLLMDAWLDAALIQEIGRLEPDRVVVAGVDAGAIRDRLPQVHVTQAATDDAAVPAAGRSSLARVWLVDGTVQAEPLAAVARQIGVAVLPVAGDARALAAPARATIAGASEVEMLSELGEDALWQLDAVRRGDELPGGGLLMFDSAEGPGRRLVAVYGHPQTAALGVLGEQSPQETIERLRSIAEGYGADGSTVVPTLEIIATVASATAGRDGDYSAVTGRDAIRPWIEAAAADGAYVVLDLQSGRSDFLSQAKIFEEFLRQPHVGLALDPEWRLKPDQVHRAQIGTVDAAEVNQVVEWLADLVRAEALPQKLLIVHQFRFSMITNRDRIHTPPELAVVIHMDGQGSSTAKHNTWNALTSRNDVDRFYWGWKNFYDEDHPLATPDQVLELSPRPVFVSFQ